MVGYDNKTLYRFLGELIIDFSNIETETEIGEYYNKGVVAGLKIAQQHIKLD